jgi:hypothetical protein
MKENKIAEEPISNEREESPKDKKSPINVKNVIFGVFFLALITSSYAYSYQKNATQKNLESVKQKTEKFVREKMVQPGTDLKITEFIKENNLYKMTVSLGKQSIVSYVTLDGKKFFPQAIDLDETENAAAATGTKAASEPAAKKDVPGVELFVMSYCPYGIQAEKGILPVVAKLGSKINFSVKFVDYTLHGKKEFDENLNQYCIEKEEFAKYDDYLTCFTKDGDSAKCGASAKLNKAKISSCISATDKQFKLTENFSASGQSSPFNIDKELNDKYGVQGSPALVVNGTVLETGRDPASLLKAVCSGFSNKPAECDSALPSDTPSPGFGNAQAAGSGAGSASCN